MDTKTPAIPKGSENLKTMVRLDHAGCSAFVPDSIAGKGATAEDGARRKMTTSLQDIQHQETRARCLPSLKLVLHPPFMRSPES